VEDHPNKSFPNCAVFPENNFAHSIMTINCFLICAFHLFIFGLKDRIRKIMLLKLKGLSETIISIVLISHTHSSNSFKMLFQKTLAYWEWQNRICNPIFPSKIIKISDTFILLG